MISAGAVAARWNLPLSSGTTVDVDDVVRWWLECEYELAVHTAMLEIIIQNRTIRLQWKRMSDARRVPGTPTVLILL